ncbi:MAG TPA: hypothetical protein VEB42_00610, partial [Chitinophagaceae bacterium]|nr:hypothetical protein [Chitinophagaceae bacterium]
EEAAWLFPVYQDAGGNYYQPKNIQHNATAKTLTVQTTHFSDWTFASRIELHAEGHVNNGTVELRGGESVNLTLVKYITDDKTSDAYQDGVPLMEDPSFGLFAKISWTKTSATGGLSADKAKAKYLAPAAINTQESLMVTATVEDDNLGKDNTGQIIRQMILSQPVVLVPEDADFFELTEDGTTYRITSPQFTLNGGFMTATGDFPGRSISISVKGSGAPGSFVYGEPGTGKANIDYIGDNTVFVDFRYDNCSNPHDIHFSPGAFTVSKVATTIGEYSEGSFSGEVYAYDWCPSQRQKVISGKFKVRKNY